ncbi:MAG: hypothetical protein KFF68_10940, partial [Desulfosarcina sp.]|nr:hypothetical protein [Desulfosarcina sp.]
VLTFSESIKSEAARNYGEPPYGRAELSNLKTFSVKMDLNLAESLARLRKAGIQVEDEQQTLLDIAKVNDTSPQQLYLRMKPEEKPVEGDVFPEAPETGFGKRILSDVCRQYGLNVPAVLKVLANEGITAAPDATIKQIAEQNDLAPQDVFAAIGKAAGEN